MIKFLSKFLCFFKENDLKFSSAGVAILVQIEMNWLFNSHREFQNLSILLVPKPLQCGR